MQIEIMQAFCIGLYLTASLSTLEKKSLLIISWVACALHVISAILALGGTSDFSLSAAHAFNFSTAFVVLGFLVSSLTQNIHALSRVLFPLAAVGVLLTMAIKKPPGQPISIGLMTHILISVIAFSIIALGAMQAVMIQILRFRLKNHQANAIDTKIPPLQSLEAVLLQTIRFGTIVLSVAIATGVHFIDAFLSMEILPKTALTVMAWLLFTSLLVGNTWFGWGGKLITQVTLIGYGLLVIGFIGIRMFIY